VKVRQFNSTCVVDEAGRAANLASAMARGLPVCSKQRERPDRLAVVASGPSLCDYMHELNDYDEVWAINGAYDFLLNHGIVADGFIGMDPLPGLAEYVRWARRHTTFYIASTCDPSVLDALDGFQVRLWHPQADGMTYPSGQWLVGGGTTAITRAPYLAHLLGFRDITVFGADSSFNGSIYCYRDGTYACDLNEPRLKVMVGDEFFETELGLMKQVAALHVLNTNFAGQLKFRCGGLMDAFLRAPTMSDEGLELDESPLPACH
jgi:hypothetical protein